MSRNVKIGLSLLSAIFLVYMLVAWMKGMHLFAADENSYTVRFQNVAGLKTGDPVMVYGLYAGRVREINLTDGGVLVEIGVDDEIKIRTDNRVELQMKELMGGKQVFVDPGASGKILEEGSELQGVTAMDISSAFSRFGRIMEQLNPEGIDSLLSRMNHIAMQFSELGKSLGKEEVRNLAVKLSGSADALHNLLMEAEKRQLISKADLAFSEVSSLSAKADTAFKQFGKLSATLNEQTLPAADTVLRKISMALDESESMLSSAEDLLHQLKDENTAMGKLLYDDQFAAQIDSTLRNLNQTLQHVRYKKLHVAMSLSHKDKSYK